ncbi:MAG: hypothetical protein R2692_02755 [Microbacterium sp.]
MRTVLPPLITPGTTPAAAAVAASLGGQATSSGRPHDTASAVVAVPMQPEAAVYTRAARGSGRRRGRASGAPPPPSPRTPQRGRRRRRVRLLHNVRGLWILSETVRGWERTGAPVELTALWMPRRRAPASSPFDVNDPRFLSPGDSAWIDAWCAEHDQVAPRTRAEYAARSSIARAGVAEAPRRRRLGVDARTIHIVGGALNALLCQRVADRSGLPVLAGPVEGPRSGTCSCRPGLPA